jgi:hypothetical protein
MKLIIPNNIFTTLFLLSLDKESRPDVEVKEASLISAELNENPDYVGIIPSFDLITNQDFYVSSKFGIGFESALSNSYLYYSPENTNVDKILLRGDITTNEVILSKLIFQERYNLQPEISIDMNEGFERNNNYLVVGSDNWLDDQFLSGTSFCEQASELIESPYLNFVFASKSENAIKEFNAKYNNMTNEIVSGLSDNLDEIGLSTELNDFIKKEIESVYFDLTQEEIEGLKEILQLAYFHQIFDDLFEIKFVE